LEYRVLGPLEVRRDGYPLTIGGPRQRALLAALLIHANEMISAPRLMEELFGAHAATARENRIQVGISRLRRALAPDNEPEVIVSQPGGYMLRVDLARLDSALFEQLLERGRDALAAADAQTAAELLERADSLWRGAPYADVAFEDVTQAEIRRLEELRVAARIERLDAELMLGREAEVVSELEGLVERYPAEERLLCQLMLALYRSGRQVDALAVCARQKRLLQDTLGLEPTPSVRKLEGAILNHDPDLLSAVRVVQAERGSVEVCPYKGLASYGTSDDEFFCGRERLVEGLLRRVAAGGLVGIVGASGVGKSSTLQAGLLPALTRGALPGSDGRRQVVIRPGAHPQRALRNAVPDRDPGDPLVVAVDQFEEVFTVCGSEIERRRFVDRLVALSAEGGSVVVVVVRADYYGRCAAYPAFARLLSANHELVSPMAREELEQAITVPADRAELGLGPGLVDALLDDVSDRPGGLPLLSTTLLELWGCRTNGVITLEAYRSLGGIQTAVARLAERAFAVLSPEGQRSTRAILRRLTVLDGDVLVRRRAALEEFEVDKDSAVAEALATLTEFRLLTVGEGTVEVSHETLLHEWPRLVQWLSEDRAGHRLQAQVASAASAWDAGGRQPEDVYRGARLAAALDWLDAYPDDANVIEREFVEASRQESNREANRQRVRNRRLVVMLGVSVVLLAIAVGAVVIATSQRRTAQAAARTALARQLGEEAVVEPRLDRAMLLAREAVALEPSPDTDGTLLATLERSPAAIGTLTVPISARPLELGLSPNGKTLAVADNLGNVRLFSTRSNRPEQLFRDVDVTHTPPMFSASGTSIYAPGSRGLEVIATRQGRVDRVLRWPASTAAAIAQGVATMQVLLSQSGQPEVVVGLDAPRPGVYLERWHSASSRPATQTLLAPGSLVAATIEGRDLLVATRTAVAAWSLPGLSLRTRTQIRLPMWSIGAFSPDGSRLMVGTQSGAVWFIDRRTGRRLAAPIGHTGQVQNVAFAPDGRTAVSVGDDHQVKVWRPAGARLLQTLSGHGGRVTGIAISRDSQTLYTSSLDGAVFEWDLGTSRRFGRTLTVSHAPPASVAGTAFSVAPALAVSPSGTAFAASLQHGRAGVFMAATARPVGGPVDLGATVTSAAWSGQAVILGTQAGRVVAWADPLRSVRTHTLGTLPQSVSGVAAARAGELVAAVSSDPSGTHGTLVLWRSRRIQSVTLPTGSAAVAISPDTSQLAVLVSNTVQIRRTRDLSIVRTLHTIGSGMVLTYAPGDVLTVGTYAGVIQRWNTTTARQINAPTQVAAAPVSSLAIDPTNHLLATGGGGDGTVRLWQLPTMAQLGTAFPAYPPHWESLGFTDAGGTLTVLDDNGQGQVWPTALTAWESQACDVAGRNLTRMEWSRYVGSQPYALPCPHSGRE
jgi:DNA-binding SARP family transcriptional activator/WD40 repeat protein